MEVIWCGWSSIPFRSGTAAGLLHANLKRMNLSWNMVGRAYSCSACTAALWKGINQLHFILLSVEILRLPLWWIIQPFEFSSSVSPAAKIKLPVFRWLHTPTYVHSRTRILRGVLYYLFKANSSKVHPWYGICRVFKVLGSPYGGGRLFGTHDKQNSATSPTQRFFSRQLLFRRGLRNPDIRSLRIASCRIDAGVGLIRLDINSVYWDRRSICLGNLEGSSGWNGFILVTITNNHSLLVESWLGWYVYINSLTTARKAGKPGINTTEIGSEK
jgi:hypothetical protein